MVAITINAEIAATAMNSQISNFVLYAKLCNHLFIAYQAIGQAITFPIRTINKYCLRISLTTWLEEEPNTFRIPISLIRCSPMNNDSPNIPIHAMNTASRVLREIIFPNLFSSEYKDSRTSSKNAYSTSPL